MSAVILDLAILGVDWGMTRELRAGIGLHGHGWPKFSDHYSMKRSVYTWSCSGPWPEGIDGQITLTVIELIGFGKFASTLAALLPCQTN